MIIAHVFSLDTKKRFGGQNILWKKLSANRNWKKSEHFVLDPESNNLVGIDEYFRFDYPKNQCDSSRFSRFYSIFRIIRFIYLQSEKEVIYHFHDVTWRGLIGNIVARWTGHNTIYESVLQGSDTPEALARTKLGGLKLMLLRKFSLVICISDALGMDFLNFGFDESQILILNNPVDTEIFKPRIKLEKESSFLMDYCIPDDAKIILFVGSVKPRKGFHILVESFLNVHSEFKDVYLLVVGPSSKSENPSIDETYVNELVSRLKGCCPDRFEMLGLVESDKEMARIFRNSDIFMFPSYEEGLGNVVLEALASNLKVVSSNLPVLEGILYDGLNCLLFPVGNHNESTRCLKIMLSEETNYVDSTKTKHYLDVDKRFNVLNWANNLEKAYFGLRGKEYVKRS